MRKITILFMIGIVVLSGIGTLTTSIGKTTPLVDDELDQQQPLPDSSYWYVGKALGIRLGPLSDPLIPAYNWTIAQSFTPNKDILTRVQLYTAKNSGVVYPYILAIRDDLNSENLAVASVGSNQFTEHPFLDWIEFDFEDFHVNISQTYYLVSYSKNITDNYYYWESYHDDLYPDGNVSYSLDDGKHWFSTDSFDMCFKTYGRDDDAPSVEIINPQDGFLHFSGIPIMEMLIGVSAEARTIGGFRIKPIQVEIADDFDDTEDLTIKIYLDDDEVGPLTFNEDSGYFEWKWTGFAFGISTLKVTAEDSGDNIGDDEIDVWNFCFLP